MIDNKDLDRELGKIADALIRVNMHLRRRDESNAELHLSSTRYTPLTSMVGDAVSSIDNLRDRLKEDEPT